MPYDTVKKGLMADTYYGRWRTLRTMSDVTIETRELKISKLGKDRWKEHFPESKQIDALHEFIDGVIRKYGNELKGTFRLSLKLNGGYGKNHDTGSTRVFHVTGYLDDIWIVLEKYFEGHRILHFREEE